MSLVDFGPEVLKSRVVYVCVCFFEIASFFRKKLFARSGKNGTG